MSLFNSYLRSRIKAIAVCIAVICIFSASYLLFDMPVIVTLYPLTLSLLVCVIAAAFDFGAYCMRHNKLIRNERPVPGDQIESDYQKIIADLEDEAERSARRATEKFSDMVEYYTIWAHQIKTPIGGHGNSPETQRRPEQDRRVC